MIHSSCNHFSSPVDHLLVPVGYIVGTVGKSVVLLHILPFLLMHWAILSGKLPSLLDRRGQQATGRG